ncbi:hypothetical protein [Shewanella fidelis]|uniref:hypothetical protein n=1 Tax=Shewanella fidelis TaxID=173509 RepID=UPI00048AD504|nr:hypothetical protein [Shewanella fidelis]
MDKVVNLRWKKLIVLVIWLFLSFTLVANAGDGAIYGALMPAGPSFMAGDYISHGFWSNDVELYMQLFWLAGLVTFILNRAYIVSYLVALILGQMVFIAVVNDQLLTYTGYALLLPVELGFVVFSVLWLKDRTVECNVE